MNKQDIIIEITLLEECDTQGGTVGFGTLSDGKGNVYPNQSSKKGKITIELCNSRTKDYATQNLRFRGQNYSTFCNELGDIKYFF